MLKGNESKLIMLLLIFTMSMHFSKQLVYAQSYRLLHDSTEVHLQGNVFYKIVYASDSTYKITWGNKDSKHTTDSTFDILGNGTFEYLKSDSNSIILDQGVGTNCTDYIVLPVTFKGKEKIYESGLAVDTKNYLVAYYNINANPPSFIEVVNYKTGKIMKIYEKDLCPAVDKSECIDKIYFYNKQLVIKWQGSKWKSFKHPDPKVKRIKIKI